MTCISLALKFPDFIGVCRLNKAYFNTNVMAAGRSLSTISQLKIFRSIFLSSVHKLNPTNFDALLQYGVNAHMIVIRVPRLIYVNFFIYVIAGLIIYVVGARVRAALHRVSRKKYTQTNVSRYLAIL